MTQKSHRTFMIRNTGRYKDGIRKTEMDFSRCRVPPEGVNSILGHESIIILNTGDLDAHVIVKFF